MTPGQISVHHALLVHGSEPNSSTLRRIGYTIRYVPTYVKQLADVTDSATLVRGSDEYGHFLHEPAPRSDFHPDALTFHPEMLAAHERILYSGTEKEAKS